jgi:hypothetical protein
MICHMVAMIIKHARNIFKGNRGRQSACIRHYLSFIAGRRENDLLDLGDLTLPLPLEAGEELLELLHLLGLPSFFDSLVARLDRLALLLWDIL